MKSWSFTRVAVVFMLLTSAIALTGMGYGFWSQTLTISKTVDTGNVNLEYLGAFTNDDATTTGGTIDSDDDDQMVQLFDFYGSSSSADPSGFGPGASSTQTSTPRYDKDVALCLAGIQSPDTATLDEFRVYPSYHCTAWFDVINNGTVPVKVKSITLVLTSTSVLIDPADASTPVDIDEDLADDVEFDIDDFALCQQIDPGETVRMTIHQHVLMTVLQSTLLQYKVLVDMEQWSALGNTVSGKVCQPSS